MTTVSPADSTDVVSAQQALCATYRAEWLETPGHIKVSVALDLNTTLLPINGLRLAPTDDTSGWSIWAGEANPPPADDVFVQVLAAELAGWRPDLLKYLGLPPGWGFRTNGVHEDVWDCRDCG